MSLGSQALSAARNAPGVLPRRLEASLTGARFLINLGLGLLLLVMAGGAAMMLADAERLSLGLLLFVPIFGVLGGLLVMVSLGQYLFGPALVLDGNGLRHAISGEVRWPQVVGIALEWTEVRGDRIPVLAVGLLPGTQVSGGWRWLRALKKRERLHIGIKGLDHSPEQILEAAIALRDRVSPPRIEAWYSAMSPELQAASVRNQRVLGRMDELASDGLQEHELEEAARLAAALAANTPVLKKALEAERRQRERSLRRLYWVWGFVAVAWAIVQLALLAKR